MEYSLREIILAGLSVMAASLLIYVSLPMARMAKDADSEYITTNTETAALADEREWSKYTGTVSGASVIGFVTRHKDSCDIVVRNNNWDARVVPYLNNGELILGLSDTRQVPDYFWDTAFLFDVLLNGHGERLYTAAFIYSYGTITGIIYTEV